MSAEFPGPSFFVTGGTLASDATSYIERQADKDLLSALLAGEYCFVLNSRQMGKSSLSVRTMNRLNESGVRTVFLDLTRFGGATVTPEQWYAGMLGEVGRALDVRKEIFACWKENQDQALVPRFFGAIREVALDSPVVLFIDEIDAVRSLSFSTDEFFAALRECYNRRVQDETMRRLTACLVGSAMPSDLIADTRTSPFNIGRRIELRDFTLDECLPLAEGLNRPNAREMVTRAFHWTNGHPYLTQALCAAIAEDSSIQTASGVDRLVESLFFEAKARERNPNLADVSNRILSSYLDPSQRDEHRAAILDLYGRVLRGRPPVADDETNRLVALLKLAGITRGENGRILVRNRIYAHVFDRAWIEQSMPDAELRRQRAAYRRGLIRAGSVFLAVLAVVVGLSLYAERQRRLAVARNVEMRRNLYVAEMNQAQQALDSGNIDLARDLLDRQRPMQKGQEDLREFAWQYLSNATRGEERLQLSGHQGAVYSIAYSPDGKTLATAGYDKTVRLWDAASGRQVAVMAGHGSPAMAAVFSRDGTRLASVDSGTGGSGHSGELKIWNVQSPSKPLQVANIGWLAGSPGSLAFSPDGKMLSGTLLGWAGFCDLVTGKVAAWVKGQRQLTPHNNSASSTDGRLIALCGGSFVMGSTSVLVYRIPKRGALADAEPPTVKTIDTQRGTVFCVGFSPDSRILACGSEDHTVQLWDTSTWKRLSTIENIDGIVSLAFSPDCRKLATGGIDGVLKLWDLATMRMTARLQGHRKRISSVAFSPDGTSIATSSEDGTGRIWDATSHGDAASLAAHDGPVRSLSFSPKGSLFATLGGTTVKVWRGRRLVRMLRIPDGTYPFTSTAFSLDGTRLAVANAGDMVTLWDVATWRESMPRLWNVRTPLAVAFSPNGRAVAAGSFGGTVNLWDSASRREQHTLTFGGLVGAVAFAPDGRCVAACSADGGVRVWDPENGRSIAILAGHEGPVRTLAFSPDGRILATGSDDGTVRLWHSGEWRKKPEVLQARLANIIHLAFSPDGKTLATAHGREALALWNVPLRREVAFLRRDEFELIRVAFSPDGQTLAAGTATGKVKFWDLSPSPKDRADSDGVISTVNRRTEAAEYARLKRERREFLAKLTLELQGTAHAEAATVNSVTTVNVTSVDSTDWHVQLHNIREGMKNGDTYSIRFKAKANQPRSILLNAQAIGGNWHSVGLTTSVALSTEWKTFQYRFRAQNVAAQNRMPNFVLGKQTGTVWISGLSVTTMNGQALPGSVGNGKK